MFLFPAPTLGLSNGIYTGVWCQGYVLYSHSMYEITKKYVWNRPFSYFLLKTWFPLEYETTIPQTLMMISFCIAGLPILWRELLCQSPGFQWKDHERDVAQVATPRNGTLSMIYISRCQSFDNLGSESGGGVREGGGRQREQRRRAKGRREGLSKIIVIHPISWTHPALGHVFCSLIRKSWSFIMYLDSDTFREEGSWEDGGRCCHCWCPWSAVFS